MEEGGGGNEGEVAGEGGGRGEGEGGGEGVVPAREREKKPFNFALPPSPLLGEARTPYGGDEEETEEETEEVVEEAEEEK